MTLNTDMFMVMTIVLSIWLLIECWLSGTGRNNISYVMNNPLIALTLEPSQESCTTQANIFQIWHKVTVT